MLASAAGFSPMADQAPVEEVAAVAVAEAPKPASPNAGVEARVREFWSDAPVMAKVAFCESNFRQFGKDGLPLRGHVNDADVGVMQINETVHLEAAAKLGLDIETLEGNLAYARHIYERQGTAPWIYSKHCWNKEVALAN